MVVTVKVLECYELCLQTEKLFCKAVVSFLALAEKM